MSLSPSQLGAGGSFRLEVMERWGLSGEQIPDPGGMLGGWGGQRGSGWAPGLLPPPLLPPTFESGYFNFRNVDVTAWKTGKAKLAESSPACI